MIYTLRFDDYEFPNQTFEISGLPVENNISEDKIPRRHGTLILDSYLNSRKIKIKGTIHNVNAADSYSELASMQEALLPAEGKFYYRSDRYINCRANYVKPSFAEGTDKAVMDVDIQLIAANPFQYSAGASYSVVENANDGVTINFDVYNGGNVFSEPKFSFCPTGGTVSDDISVTNLTTGKSMKYRGTISDGKTLEIDTDEYVVEMDGTDGLSYFEGDFLTLAAGTNSFQYVGSTIRMTTEHKYRWY